MSTAENLEIVFVILIVLTVIIVILDMTEKKFRKLYNLHKNSRNNIYRRKLRKLKYSRQNPENTLESINLLARNFFKEAFNIHKNIEYSELIDLFREKRNKEGITFSKMMVSLSYSGENLDENKNKILISIFDKMIKKNRIVPEKEKLQIEKDVKKIEKIEVRKEKIQKDIKKYKRLFSLRNLFQIDSIESKNKKIEEQERARIRKLKSDIKSEEKI